MDDVDPKQESKPPYIRGTLGRELAERLAEYLEARPTSPQVGTRELPSNYDALKDAIRSHNCDAFEGIISVFCREKLSRSGVPSLYKDFGFKAGGLHYISRSFGRWFRLNIGCDIDTGGFYVLPRSLSENPVTELLYYNLLRYCARPTSTP